MKVRHLKTVLCFCAFIGLEQDVFISICFHLHLKAVSLCTCGPSVAAIFRSHPGNSVLITCICASVMCWISYSVQKCPSCNFNFSLKRTKLQEASCRWWRKISCLFSVLWEGTQCQFVQSDPGLGIQAAQSCKCWKNKWEPCVWLHHHELCTLLPWKLPCGPSAHQQWYRRWCLLSRKFKVKEEIDEVYVQALVTGLQESDDFERVVSRI